MGPRQIAMIIYTLRKEIFAGKNLPEFRRFWLKSQKKRTPFLTPKMVDSRKLIPVKFFSKLVICENNAREIFQELMKFQY